jgi:hypothetical protein
LRLLAPWDAANVADVADVADVATTFISKSPLLRFILDGDLYN